MSSIVQYELSFINQSAYLFKEMVEIELHSQSKMIIFRVRFLIKLMNKQLSEIINLKQNPISTAEFITECNNTLNMNGVLVLSDFLNKAAIESINNDAENQRHLAYYTKCQHNIYLTDTDPQYDENHARNRLVSSSKGCITTDQVPVDSVLKVLYESTGFKSFLCQVLGEKQLYEFADNLSSINLHYADEGQELGWHFDNSSFAITLLIKNPKAGGEFEFVKDARNADIAEMGLDTVHNILNGQIIPKKLKINEGDLVLFRGRNSIHRVTPVKGKDTRKLVVLAYNSSPDISLSESARMTFYGRLG